jgi:hypothetical protein
LGIILKFKLIRELANGKYYCYVSLLEFSEQDKKKANKFGVPNLEVLLQNGSLVKVSITSLEHMSVFGFPDQKQADTYAEKLKNQIVSLKESWENLKDNWSTTEEL